MEEIQWIIFGGHRPFLCSDLCEYGSHSPTGEFITTFEDLFIKYRVDIVMTGHMHCYERTYPFYKGKVISKGVKDEGKVFINPKAPIYITQGTAGAMIREKWLMPQPEWSKARNLKFGYGRMTFLTNNTIYYEDRNIHGNVLDEFYLIKN